MEKLPLMYEGNKLINYTYPLDPIIIDKINEIINILNKLNNFEEIIEKAEQYNQLCK